MLLYARTWEEVEPDLNVIIGGNRIMARTLDLNCDFSAIREQLNSIASEIEVQA